MKGPGQKVNAAILWRQSEQQIVRLMRPVIVLLLYWDI